MKLKQVSFCRENIFRQIDTAGNKTKGKRQNFFRQITARTNWRIIVDKEKVRNLRTEVIKLETHSYSTKIILGGYIQIIFDGYKSVWTGLIHLEWVQIILNRSKL